MELVLNDIELPVRLRTKSPMGDEEFLRFCAANEAVRMELEPNGEITVVSPSGLESSRMNQRIGRLLDEWAWPMGGAW